MAAWTDSPVVWNPPVLTFATQIRVFPIIDVMDPDIKLSVQREMAAIRQILVCACEWIGCIAIPGSAFRTRCGGIDGAAVQQCARRYEAQVPCAQSACLQRNHNRFRGARADLRPGAEAAPTIAGESRYRMNWLRSSLAVISASRSFTKAASTFTLRSFRSGASKLTSSSSRSRIVCSRRAPMFWVD